MKSLNRIYAVVSLALACVFSISGCSGMRLYNEARDKQGEAATKAWSEVDLKAYFQSQRDERKKLLQAELDSVTFHVMTRRENTMRVVANGTVNDFDTTLAGEIANLVDGGVGQLDRWVLADRALTARHRELAFSRDLLFLHAPGISSCAVALKTDPISPAKTNAYLKDFKIACNKEKAASDLVAQLEKSLGGAYSLGLEEEAKRVEEVKANSIEKKAQYKTALKAYEDAVNSTPAADRKTSVKIAEAGGELRKALDALLKLQDKFGYARETLAKERISTLGELLEKVESGADPGKDAGHTEIQALMLPKIADDLQAINTITNTTPKAALLIRRDIEKGRADAAALEISYAERRVALSKSILASRFQEALLIRSAQKKLEPAMRSKPVAAEKYQTALSTGTTEVKTSLIGAAGDYLDAIGRQRSQTQRLETLKTAIVHERSIGYAENSADQWSALIGSTVAQAAEYAAGGQKFSEYKDLVQTLTLFWIGRGVNK
jgi:hypothetical protein